ncbi:MULTISPECIES: oligosaccharide flippase family protein [Cysteiniphilum]|uniref:oligosaccharide flippase family protein n=1 Tax=Cysteiniphilum TaxID=2056696 RepID=UPI0017864DC3|nr:MULTISPECIES: oligosaccharide flippase family protein [Cysteiniphilum]
MYNKQIFSKLKLFAATSSAQYVSMLVGVCGLIITVAKFGVYGRGEYAVAYSIVSTFGLLFGWSLGRSAIYFIKNTKLTAKEFFVSHLISIMLLFLLLMVSAILIFLMFLWLLPSFKGDVEPLYLMIMLVSLPYTMWQFCGTFFYAQVSKIGVQSIVVVINRVLLLILLVILIYCYDYNLVWLFIIFSGINLLSFLVELLIFFFLIRPKCRINLAFMIKLVTKGGVVHLDSVFGTFIFSTNVIFVNYVLGTESAGVYSIVIQFHSLLFILPTAGLMLMQKELAVMGLKCVRRDFLLYFSACILLVLMSIPFVYYAIYLIFLLSDKQSGHQLEVFYLFLGILPAFLLMSATQILNPVLIYLNKINELLKYTLILSVFNIVVLVICLKYIGLFGSVLAITTTSFAMLLVYFWLLKLYKNNLKSIGQVYEEKITDY